LIQTVPLLLHDSTKTSVLFAVTQLDVPANTSVNWLVVPDTSTCVICLAADPLTSFTGVPALRLEAPMQKLPLASQMIPLFALTGTGAANSAAGIAAAASKSETGRTKLRFIDDAS
jgi:hypothetical protein